MKIVSVPFNNTGSQSWEALVNNVSVISYRVEVKDSTLPITVGRVETRLDKLSRDTSDFIITGIDFEKGLAMIMYTDNSDAKKIEIIHAKNTRIFINALIMNNEITAITGFTACGVIL